MNRKKMLIAVLRRRIWKIPVWLIVVLLGVSAVTGGILYTLKIPSTVTILPPPEGSYEIKIYEDSECTIEVTSFDFGERRVGEEFYTRFYLKNLSNVTIAVSCSWGSDGRSPLNWAPCWQEDVEPDEIREWNLWLKVQFFAEEGTYNFDTLFNVYPSPQG